jgi:hypothetical protein
MVVVKGRVELVGPMDSTAIDDHHDLFVGFAKGGQHLMDVLAQFLGIKVRHDFIEDFGSPILDRTNDVEQDPAGDPTPRAILQPRVPFESLVTFDLIRTQRPYTQARALGCAPPTRPRQGKTPEDGFVFIEQNDLAPAGLVFESREFDRGIRESRGGGIKSPGGAVVAQVFFFNTQRTLSRPSWTPVSRAKTVASSRQLHWEWREPCSRGS